MTAILSTRGWAEESEYEATSDQQCDTSDKSYADCDEPGQYAACQRLAADGNDQTGFENQV
jgi:hypothetical protein